MNLGLKGSVTTDGAGTPANLDFSGVSTFGLKNKAIKLSLLIDDPTKLSNATLFAALESNLTDNIKFRFNAMTASSQMAKPNDVTVIMLTLSEINTVAGSIALVDSVPTTTSGFTAIRLQITDDSTGVITVNLLGVEIVDLAPESLVTVSFDDGHMSLMSRGFPSMRERGIKGTCYTIADAVGGEDRITMDALETLHDSGWEIGGHAYSESVHDSRYSGISSEVAMEDLLLLKYWLSEHFNDPGGRYSFAYPGGVYEDTTDGVSIEALVKGAGFDTGRTILSSVGVSTHEQISSVPVPMRYRMYGMSGISSESLNQLNPATLVGEGGMLEKLENNGGWMHLVFHQIVAGSPTGATQISQADFDMVMDNLVQRNVSVAPTRDAVSPLGQFRVTGRRNKAARVDLL